MPAPGRSLRPRPIGPGRSNYTFTYANASTGLTVAPQGAASPRLPTRPFPARTRSMTAPPRISSPTSAIPTLFGTVSGDVVTLAQRDRRLRRRQCRGGQTVTFSGYTISGADAADYALSQPASSTATITAAGLTITITASTQSKTYGFGGTSALPAPPPSPLPDCSAAIRSPR